MNTYHWFTPTADRDAKGRTLMAGPCRVLEPLNLDPEDVGPPMFAIEQGQKVYHAFEDELDDLSTPGLKLPADHQIRTLTRRILQ